MKIPVITVGGHVEAGKTTLLQKLEQSLSMADKVKIKIDHEPVGALQTFLVCFYIPKLCFKYLPNENGSFVCCEPTCKVIVMDRGLDSGQLFTTFNKHHLTDIGLLYLTDKYLDIKTRFFPGKLFATDGVFYLATEPAEALERVSCRSCSSEEQITFNYMNDLDTSYNTYMDSVLSEINYCTITSEEDSTKRTPDELHKNCCKKTLSNCYVSNKWK